MLLVRPISLDDLGQFEDLVKKTGAGMTNLPSDSKLLKAKIQNSLNSFAIKPTRPGNEAYLFVLEDLENNQIIGSCEIHSKIGGFEPSYTYEIKNIKHISEALNTEKDIDILQLAVEHNGPTEICSLFLDPEKRQSGLGRLLSLSRFHFISQQKDRFEDTVVAELRGMIDEDTGHCPFWEHVVNPFFEMDYKRADYLSITDRRFIAELMPKHPIYIPLLPEEAREVIGKVHTKTEPAHKMLLDEGFEFTGNIDIFDAGPRIGCEVSNIRTIKESRKTKIKEIIKHTEEEENQTDKSRLCLLSNCSIEFRACMDSIEENEDGSINISYQTASALNLKHDDLVAYSPIYRNVDQGKAKETCEYSI